MHFLLVSATFVQNRSNGLLEYKYREMFVLVWVLFVLYWVKVNNKRRLLESVYCLALEWVISRGYYYFRSILCWSHYLLSRQYTKYSVRDTKKIWNKFHQGSVQIRAGVETLPPQLRNLPYLSPALPSLTFYGSPTPSFARFCDTYIFSFNYFFSGYITKTWKGWPNFFKFLSMSILAIHTNRLLETDSMLNWGKTRF